MTCHSPRTPARRRSKAAAAGILAASLFTGVTTLITAAPAGATTLSYSGSTSGTQSTIVIHKGDAYERTIHPVGRVTSTLDDTAKKVTSAQVSFDPVWTDIQTVAGLKVYTRTDLTQIGAATGTSNMDGNGQAILAVNATTRIGMTVYISKDGTKQPATDQKLADRSLCYVDAPLALSGTANRRTGSMSLTASKFTIPYFGYTAGTTCGWATGSLNLEMAGANNSIALNFAGAPTQAHYTGVTSGTQSSVLIKEGDTFLQRRIRPVGSIQTDVDFVTGKVTNTKAVFKSTTVSALPPVLSFIPAFATFDLTTLGTPTTTMAASGTAGVDNVTVKTKIRMAMTIVFGTGDEATSVTDPSACYVDLDLNLKGTSDRGTNVLKLSQPSFTIPAFPAGCGKITELMTYLVSGSSNSISLVYVDGVIS